MPRNHASVSFSTPTIFIGTLPSASADQMTSLSPWATQTLPPTRPAMYSSEATTSAGLVKPSFGQYLSSAIIQASWFM